MEPVAFLEDFADDGLLDLKRFLGQDGVSGPSDRTAGRRPRRGHAPLAEEIHELLGDESDRLPGSKDFQSWSRILGGPLEIVKDGEQILEDVRQGELEVIALLPLEPLAQVVHLGRLRGGICP